MNLTGPDARAFQYMSCVYKLVTVPIEVRCTFGGAWYRSPMCFNARKCIAHKGGRWQKQGCKLLAGADGC